MKGIILAGGYGSRLYPITLGASKHLLPIYDKPMIYYSLSVLMLAGIRDILIITSPTDKNNFQHLLGNGENFGVHFEYAIQDEPKGLAQAFTIGKDFIGKSNVCLVLGDNIFWGQGFTPILNKVAQNNTGATIFGYKVGDPENFGVIEFDSKHQVISLEEKPIQPKSNFAITGLYFYNNTVIDIAKEVKPSARGELEITAINQMYLQNNALHVELLGRGFAWLDAGNHTSLLEASLFVETIEKRQGYKIACLEEIAWNHGWLSKEQIQKAATRLSKSSYGSYLEKLIS